MRGISQSIDITPGAGLAHFEFVLRMAFNLSRLLYLAALVGVAAQARAEPNPVRAGFCASWPASYSDFSLWEFQVFGS
jgi:hypothetical protein